MSEKILVVDDEAPICFTLERLLKRAGYMVEQAKCGMDALRILCDEGRAGSFGLLIMDMSMPDMTGIEVVQRLQKQSVSIPVLPMSGAFDEKMHEHLQRYGCFLPLEKPFTRDELMSRIEGIFGNGE